MTFEEIDPRGIDTMRQLRREAEDAEYEGTYIPNSLDNREGVKYHTGRT